MITRSEKETEALGERIGRRLQKGDTVLLYGEPGTGKTAFVRGAARGFGIEQQVHSPTFTIVNEYPSNDAKLIHMDLYRLDRESVWDMGLDDYFDGKNICIVEWPNDLCFCGDALIVHLAYHGEGREITFSAQGSGIKEGEEWDDAVIGD